jgi:hypothetical protein
MLAVDTLQLGRAAGGADGAEIVAISEQVADFRRRKMAGALSCTLYRAVQHGALSPGPKGQGVQYMVLSPGLLLGWSPSHSVLHRLCSVL